MKTHEAFPSAPPSRVRSQTYTHAHPYDSKRPLDYSSSNSPTTDRQKHLQYIHSLMHVLLQRHPTLASQEDKQKNATRIGRIVRVLWSCREWREGDLWKEGLAWAGLGSEQQQEHANREAFLKAVSQRRKGLRPLLLATRVQELVAAGKWKEALDEIELVIQVSPYRASPELNMYAGLLVVLLQSTA